MMQATGQKHDITVPITESAEHGEDERGIGGYRPAAGRPSSRVGADATDSNQRAP